MTKDKIDLPESFFHRYISLVEEIKLERALEIYGPEIFAEHRKKLIELSDFAYSEGKWTIKQILQHCIDTERIFQYRALRLSRKDATPLPGFNENDYAANVNVSHRTVDDLLDEWQIVRLSTVKVFENLEEDVLLFNGTASNFTVNALAFGFTICGHAIHHLNILKERYFSIS
jgi:hypothetical protein